jgi:glycosyltransferase involved in cell wall biosynthesis
VTVDVRIGIINSIRAYGGGEKWALRSAGLMRERGHAVTIICAPGSDLEARCREADLPCVTVRMRHDVSPAGVLGLARALSRASADAAVCCNERAARLAALAHRLMPGGRPVLLYRNGLEASFKNKTHNRVVVAPRVARFVANSEAVRREMLAFGWIPAERLGLIYNGVDVQAIRGADPAGVREELGAGPEDVVLLSAARLVPEKGHALLLEALAVLPATATLWIAGEGPEAASLRERAAALGLGERVHFLGFRADVPRLLRAADALCHPSSREGAPNIVLEAMAAGLPVVALDASGTGELVADGETGLLSAPGDPEALRRNLEAVVRDADLRRRLGEAGLKRVKAEFTEERSVDRWLELMQACLAESRARAAGKARADAPGVAAE